MPGKLRGKSTVAIIGAGMAGASLARMLVDEGVSVTLFDKARGVGGRMATRYTDQHEFDHGAPCFTVRSDSFRDFLAPFQGSMAVWQARVTTLVPGGKPYKRPWFEPHYVGTPRMNSLCKAIVQGITVHTGQQITSISGNPGAWYLESEAALSGPFDWVISTAPAPQTANLLRVAIPGVRYDPLFALLAPLASRPNFDAAVVRDSAIDWLSITAGKPGRDTDKTACLVAHAGPTWSREHLECPSEAVRRQLLGALRELSAVCLDDAAASVHRWRFARVARAAEAPFHLDTRRQLAACGDWGVGTGVEAAFTSARALFAELPEEMSS